jgi:hypothetical protein
VISGCSGRWSGSSPEHGEAVGHRGSRGRSWLAQDEAARADTRCVNRTTGVVVVASMALAAVAIIVAAYLLPHKPETEASSAFD